MSYTCICTLPPIPQLHTLHVVHCACLGVLPSLAGCNRMRKLLVSNCARLIALRNCLPPGLAHLRVVNCPLLCDLTAVGAVHAMGKLSLERCPAVARLPVLFALQTLHLSECPALEALLDLPLTLRMLSVHRCDAVHTLRLDGLVQLEELHIHRRAPQARLGLLGGLENLRVVSTSNMRIRISRGERARLTRLTVDGVAR